MEVVPVIEVLLVIEVVVAAVIVILDKVMCFVLLG